MWWWLDDRGPSYPRSRVIDNLEITTWAPPCSSDRNIYERHQEQLIISCFGATEWICCLNSNTNDDSRSREGAPWYYPFFNIRGTECMLSYFPKSCPHMYAGPPVLLKVHGRITTSEHITMSALQTAWHLEQSKSCSLWFMRLIGQSSFYPYNNYRPPE